MDAATARALNAINRSFYTDNASAFSATRDRPWPGWLRVRDVLESRRADARDALRVLDVGCGNARLGRFLAERAPGLRYLGLDASQALLDLARRAGGLGPHPELRCIDLVEDDWPAALGARRFDLVAVFGVLHHVPGAARRRALLAGLLARLAEGGLLALTSWRLARFQRFRDRCLEPTSVDPAQLEAGDRLLPWGRGEGLRYVHFADEDETGALVASLDARIVACFDADGGEQALNRYWLLEPGP